MRKGQQFKIESIEELKEAYEKLSTWQYTFEEIEEFYVQDNFWISLNSLGNYDLGCRDYDKETIPNPFKKEKGSVPKPKNPPPPPKRKEKECPFSNQFKDAVFYIPTYFDLKNPEEVADREDKEALILEELNALRKEVEELKGKASPISIIDLGEIEKAFEDKYTRKGIIEETIEFFKGLKEKKPKEYPEQKGMLQLNLGNCAFEILSSRKWVDVTVKEGTNYASISLEKPDAIKIVDYLKKHFEIED